MTLELAKKKYVRHGAAGLVLFALGMGVVADGVYRRLSELQEALWLVECALGVVVLLVALMMLGSAVRYLVHIDRLVESADRRARKRNRKNEGVSKRASHPEQAEPIRSEPVRLKVN